MFSPWLIHPVVGCLDVTAHEPIHCFTFRTIHTKMSEQKGSSKHVSKSEKPWLLTRCQLSRRYTRKTTHDFHIRWIFTPLSNFWTTAVQTTSTRGRIVQLSVSGAWCIAVYRHVLRLSSCRSLGVGIPFPARMNVITLRARLIVIHERPHALFGTLPVSFRLRRTRISSCCCCCCSVLFFLVQPGFPWKPNFRFRGRLYRVSS